MFLFYGKKIFVKKYEGLRQFEKILLLFMGKKTPILGRRTSVIKKLTKTTSKKKG